MVVNSDYIIERNSMKIYTPRALVACEESGRVRDALSRVGFDAMSSDLLPSRTEGKHYQGDVRDILYDDWDLLIAHPPCTYLSSSGLHWNKRTLGRAALTEDALTFVRLLLDAPAQYIALENPVGCISSQIREPDQIIQPWMFGENASKATCFWLKGLTSLVPTSYHPPRTVLDSGKWVMRWDNQTDSGQNRLGPSVDRAKIRSATYEGIADAIADQWGRQIINLTRTQNSVMKP
jgi:hypothetical protein